VWSADGSEPIGAAYGSRIPRARFWNPSHPDANVLRQLEAAFPDDAVDFGAGSRDGKFAIVHVWSDRDPGSDYLFDRDARKTQLLFRRKPWLDPAAMATTQAIAFKARDGLELHGYFTAPLHAGTGPAPLVVMPHGGPYGISDDWGFDEEVQLLAARGYAVLKVNFRGSSGYGRKFLESGFREWGGKMQADVTDATRWAIQQGLADPSKVCIWGGSYGGYAALMGAIEEPDLYRCVIASSAVTDVNLMWKWGDIHRSISGRSYLKRDVGDDPKHLREVSPVAHAGEIKAALFLVHGMRDDRVSYEHAKAMRAALDKAGKKYESWFPRDETHGIYGDENREEYYERVLKFLDANIGNAAAVADGAGRGE
jgi:dipeptidyl aminopeptidase/acylaminoacyl peptidase